MKLIVQLVAIIIYVAVCVIAILWIFREPYFGCCPECGSKLTEFGATNNGHVIGCSKCGWDERRVKK